MLVGLSVPSVRDGPIKESNPGRTHQQHGGHL